MDTLAASPDGRRVAVLYAAKSSQDARGSIPTQLADARVLAEGEGYEVDSEHQDESFSGYTGNRGPGLEAARARAAELAAEHGSCLLVAQHSDRFARGGGNAPDAAQHLAEVLFWAMRCNVRLRSVQDDANLTSPLLAFVMGERNYEDSKRKSLATRDGKRRAAERGQRNGGPRPYGYEQSEGRLIPRREEFAVLRLVRLEVLAGKPQSAIAAGLNADGVRTVRGAAWSQARVGQTIRNPLYAGWVKHRGTLHRGAHEAVFTQAEFDEVQGYLAARARVTSRGGGRPTSGSHLFVGRLMRCGCCGCSIVPRSAGDSYRCLGQLQKTAPDCRMPSVRREWIDEAVLAYFERVGVDVEATRRHFAHQIGQRVEETRTQAERAEREALQSTAAVEKAEAEWAAGELGGKAYERLAAKYEAQRRAAEAEAARLRERERELAADATELDAEEETLRYLADLRAAIAGTVTEAGSVEAVRAALLRLFDGFTLHSYEAGIRDDSPLPDGWVRSRLHFEPELLVVGGFHIEAHPKPQVILDTDRQIEFPQLSRTGLFTGERTIASRR